MRLARDGNGEPIRQLSNRDSRGRFTTPTYRFVWEEEPPRRYPRTPGETERWIAGERLPAGGGDQR
jgi:hypothetical protein